MGSRIYLSGPMTGLPEFNYPAFNAAAKQLREMGYEVANPAENNLPKDSSWETYMKNAIKEMADCDMVALLDGFQNSKGAMIEVNLALDLKITVVVIEILLKNS